jgi:RecJ-like exonuclease
MKCELCNGTGDGATKGLKGCSVCNGSGEVCDICGEATEPGQNICDECENDEE